MEFNELLGKKGFELLSQSYCVNRPVFTIKIHGKHTVLRKAILKEALCNITANNAEYTFFSKRGAFDLLHSIHSYKDVYVVDVIAPGYTLLFYSTQ